MPGRGGRGGGKKSGVNFIKPSDPAFLRRLKEQIGYKEADTVDTKREVQPAFEAEDEQDQDDEQPTVVVLKSGDLSQEEANKLLGVDIDKDAVGSDNGEPVKPVFKKPDKRKADADSESLNPSGSKKDLKISSHSKKVKNKSLLSFDDEEDDDDS